MGRRRERLVGSKGSTAVASDERTKAGCKASALGATAAILPLRTSKAPGLTPSGNTTRLLVRIKVVWSWSRPQGCGVVEAEEEAAARAGSASPSPRPTTTSAARRDRGSGKGIAPELARL